MLLKNDSSIIASPFSFPSTVQNVSQMDDDPNKTSLVDCSSWEHINPNESIELAYQIARAAVGIFAMIGNLLIILSVIRFNYLKKASAYYLCNMALADFLLGFVGATYYLRVSYFSKTSQITRNLSFVVHNFAVLHSMSSMVIVAADRFSYICHPLTYEAKIFATRPYLFIIVSLVWTTVLICALTYLFVNHIHIMIKYGSFFDLVYFIIAVVLLCVLYGAILKVAHEQRAKDKKQMSIYMPNPNSNNTLSVASNGNAASSASATGGAEQTRSKTREAKANRKVIYGYMFIVGTFTVTYIFAYVMLQIRHHIDYCAIGYENTSQFYFFLLTSITLQNFNAACNPIVYTVCLSHFKKAFRKNIIQIATCCRVSGDRRDTQTTFVLDVPDDRKASSFSKRSTNEKISRNSILSNGINVDNKNSPNRKPTKQSNC